MALPPEFDTPEFRKGLAVRREVVGAEYVDKSVNEVDDFMKPMQKMTTEWCWGEIWTRPLLDRKTRSLINLAMLSALNRPNEVKLHGARQLQDRQRGDQGHEG
jgi:4-carboxymuconolactone decarboxylase